jgi:hypothetical protein
MVELNIDLNKLTIDELKIIINLSEKSKTENIRLNNIHPVVKTKEVGFYNRSNKNILDLLNNKTEEVCNKIKKSNQFFSKKQIGSLFGTSEKISTYYIDLFIKNNNLEKYIIKSVNILNGERLNFMNNRARTLQNTYNYTREKAYGIAGEEFKNHKKSFLIKNTNNNNYDSLDISNKFDYKEIHPYYYDEIRALLLDRLKKEKKLKQYDLAQVLILNDNEYYPILQKIISFGDNIIKDLELKGKLVWNNGDIIFIESTKI